MKIAHAIIALCLAVLPLSAKAESIADSRPTREERIASPYSNGIKFTFLGWITGSTKLSYERAYGMKVPQSSELALGIIGAGGDKFGNDPLGVTVRYGHKFFLAGYKPEDPLQGFFVRPELIWTRYEYNAAGTGERALSHMGAVLGTFGYQYTVSRFVADAWIGAGYCLGTPADTGYEHGFKVWDLFNTYNPHVALSFSIRLGILF